MDPVDRLKIALGLVLATRRAAAGWSQQSLALRAGVNLAYLGKLERGEAKVSLEQLSAIAAPFALFPEELIGEARRRLGEVADDGSVERPAKPSGRPKKHSSAPS
ncbi:helix-turn-helix domain-containing protein [Roseateles sp. L2-2]|uniref:helix-turn-helix domain-containing protein n=1 Tax=Roseateles sp. L2-2 TaxID=3422597 RepID=UPI003D3636AC